MPSYNTNDHSRYVKRLIRALYQDGCLNVALSGPYGSGKSSILSEFEIEAKASGHKLAVISLSTITGIPEGEKPISLLEREILGQLIYQGEPSKSQYSSFNRVHRAEPFEKFRLTLVIFLTLALVVTLILATSLLSSHQLTLKDIRIDEFLNACSASGIWIVAGIASAALLVLARLITSLLPRGLRLGSLSAAGTTLTLTKDDEGASYFNKYRDELIYLFEENKFDTVVFEDIDRFNNLEIFNGLRNLNVILNNAPGITRGIRGHQVAFVYAVRDSLFEVPEEREDEHLVAGSGRVKLFDQIISVLPFVSDISSFDIASGLFLEEERPSNETPDEHSFEELLRVAAPFIGDMRLLKAVHNDYLVMLEETGLSSRRESSLGLTRTGILAMAFYKNVYPAEFEKLRLGKGLLYELYDVHDAAIKDSLASLQQARATLRKLELDKTVPSELAEKLGSELLTSFEKRALRFGHITIGGQSFNLQGYGSDGLKSIEFWREYLMLSQDDTLVLGRSGYNEMSLRITKREFADLFFDGSPRDSIDDFGAAGIIWAGLPKIEQRIDVLRGADFDTDWDLPCRLRGTSDAASSGSFLTKTQEVLGEGTLAFELVFNGFLRKDFALYVSKYPDGARAGAINFIKHYYERGLQNVAFKLTPDDCYEVLRTLPASHMRRKCCLNADLLVYLLGTDRFDLQARYMVGTAAREFEEGGGAALEYALAQFNVNDKQTKRLIDLAVPQFDKALDYFICYGMKHADSDEQLALTRCALYAMTPERKYECEECGQWLCDHFSELNLEPGGRGQDWISAVAGLMSAAHLELTDLHSVNPLFWPEFTQLGLYKLNRNNLLAIVGKSTMLPLDSTLFPDAVRSKVLASFDACWATIDAYDSGEIMLSATDPETLGLIVGPGNDWGNQEGLSMVLEKLIDNASRVPVEDISSIVDGLLKYGDSHSLTTVLTALKRNEMISATLINAVTLAKLCSGNNEEATFSAIFDDFVQEILSALETKDGELDVNDAALLARRLIISKQLDNDEILRALQKLVELQPNAFPLDIGEQLLTPKSQKIQLLLCSMYEHNYIGPGEKVYARLTDENWATREKILKKWDAEGYRPWTYRFPLLAKDIPHVISSRSLEGTQIKSSVLNYWHDYLAASGAGNAEKRRLIKEIEKRLINRQQ